MKKISQEYFFDHLDFFVQEAKSGKIFVYPTDTIYWIWWIFPLTLQKIYEIKQRPHNKKVSVIIPSQSTNLKESIKNIPLNLKVDVNKLVNVLQDIWNQGKWFTVIWKMKDKYFESLTSYAKKIYQDKTLWVRILNSKFQDFVNKLSIPFITTSANLSGESVITNVDELPLSIWEKVDYIIDWWKLLWDPSIIVDITSWDIQLIYRKR